MVGALGAGALRAGPIEDDAPRFRDAAVEVEPALAVDGWQLPFATRDRSQIKTIAVVSEFGAPRQSYRRGHRHTGLDLVPRPKPRGYVDVYAMANGAVCSIHLSDPHPTVVVKHRLADGSLLYTSYKHLGGIDVRNGQQVTPATKIGRLYTADEARRLGGNYDHLHLEVRKDFADYGVASWLTMTRRELDARFVDPLLFLRRHLAAASSRPAAPTSAP
ncbi:MAG: M23 family metallopeptidase [Deltaproteobacteria bacterium]|nr:M23 family metallopeptidase [Deltaproteobacteria bacterium]